MSWDVLVGDTRAMLRTLPERSVQTCVTSPPYYSLRAYGTDPQVWGGDDGCDHEWGAEQAGQRQRWGDTSTLSEKQASNRGAEANVAALERSAGQFCVHCGAWRGELGAEPAPELFIEHLVLVFREVRRVLRDDGTLWVNMGDSFYGDSPIRASAAETFSKTWDPALTASRGGNRRSAARQGDLKRKDLMGIPWMLAFALRKAGWYLRMDDIWAKPNGFPEPVEDRPTKTHEYVFLLTKSERYFYDHWAVKEPTVSTPMSGNGYKRSHRLSMGGRGNDRPWEPGGGRNLRSVWTLADPEAERERGEAFVSDLLEHLSAAGVSDEALLAAQAAAQESAEAREGGLSSVWTINPKGYAGAHFAVFPEAIPRRCILAGTSTAGQCPACGAPFRRVLEKGEPDRAWQLACGGDAQGEYHGEAVKEYAGTGAQNASEVKARILAGLKKRRTIGWASTCKCHAGPPVPQLVLDPFSGSGTTIAEAKRLGRHGVGCELNPEYAELSHGRIDTVTAGFALADLVDAPEDEPFQPQAALALE